MLAIDQLSLVTGPFRVAPLYRTAPNSPVPQASFLNTALLGVTDLEADALLAVAKSLERRAGRRRGIRFGPRPLDIDLLLYDDWTSSAPELTLPHPRLRERRFVLAPLADLAPDLPVPPDGRTVGELLAGLPNEQEVERVGWGAGL